MSRSIEGEPLAEVGRGARLEQPQPAVTRWIGAAVWAWQIGEVPAIGDNLDLWIEAGREIGEADEAVRIGIVPGYLPAERVDVLGQELRAIARRLPEPTDDRDHTRGRIKRAVGVISFPRHGQLAALGAELVGSGSPKCRQWKT